jgi:CspA family cold shock protein
MKNFTDRWETDEDGNKFVFTVEMQRRLSEAGLPVEVENLDQIDMTPAPVSDDYQAPSRSRESAPNRSREERPQTQSAPQEDIVGPESIQIDPMSGKYVGRVKWYNARKGYGFILRGANEEIFFHRSAAVGDPEALADGLWILYDVEETAKGPEATDIEPYENAEA